MAQPLSDSESYYEITTLIVNECREALGAIDPVSVVRLVDAILEADQVFFIGVGRVMLALEAMAKRFAHLGIKTFCVGQITEPASTPHDLLIVGSGSGETLIPVAIAGKAHRLGVKVAYIGANPESSIYGVSDLFIQIPVNTKLASQQAKILSVQPMTSLFEQCLFLLGDVMAQMILGRSGWDKHELWKYHANLE